MNVVSVRTLTAIFAALMITGFVWLGLRSAGSPADARVRRLDDRRVSDLDQLSNVIDVYWTRAGALPASLEALPPDSPTRDPERGTAYGYRIVTGGAGVTYELCADFASDGGVAFWAHGAGRTCFALVQKKLGR